MELPQRNEKPFTISDGDIMPKQANPGESREVLTDRNVKAPNAHALSDHPTTFLETLTHLLRGNIGSGLFAMGDAFKNGGLILGPILTLYLGIVCVHNQHVLLKCSRRVKELKGLQQDPDFAETVEMCFEYGPPKMQSWSRLSKLIVNIFLCVTQIGFCCVYIVFAGSTLKQLMDYYGYEFDIHMHMFFVLLPMLLPSLIPNLKYLAPCSMIANVCMAVGIGVVLYYAMQDIPAASDRKYIGELSTIPLFFGTAIYAFEGIALVLPLKNSMKHPESFDKPLGVLNIGISIVTVLFISFGFFGYLKWGENVAGSLTLNLPEADVLAKVVKFAVGFGMCLTFSLQFFIPIQIMWPYVEKKLGPFSSSTFSELIFRAFMVFVTFAVAELVPHLNIFISLIGAFCSSALALLIPAIIEVVLAYGTTDGPSYFVLSKNAFIMILGLLGFLTGTYESMAALVAVFNS